MYRLEITKKIANGGVVTVTVTALLTALFWFIPLWLSPDDLPSVSFSFMGKVIFDIPAIPSRITAFVFWLVIWYLVNDRCEKAHIIPVRSVMTFVIGMAAVTAIPGLQVFDSQMIAFLFSLSALMTIFNLYTVSDQVNESFRAVIFILISSLFVPEYIWMLGLFFVGLAVYKVRSMRIFLSLLVALLVFVWMVWGICFSLGETSYFYDYVNLLIDFGFSGFHGNVVHLVGSALLVVIMIIVMVAIAGISHKYDARVRLNCSFINMAFCYSMLLMLLWKGVNVGLVHIVVLLMAMLTALYFTTRRNNFSNILFLVSLFLLLLFRVADGLIQYEI